MITVGKLYEVTMPGEPEFGGRVRVVSATPEEVTTRFEYPPWTDTEVLYFRVTSGGLQYKPFEHDAFPGSPVKFKEVK